MKAIDGFRICLTVVILIFVWLGHSWAIKLSITLSVIACETFALVLAKKI